ncbi:LysR family transcriptional regulator [Cupriavidus agavae]|uniref:LysR family transcriptional regulator n=1 Tax=Cupriavidus agavae TaxID=1001822 RepID=A0A4Q7S7S2_9BURK|nr:LysR family transcriptional regulator [Cupriavidus agavae]RZT41778.1 LysR family transcriptional regulator [Cupriavidus agavae]
MNLKRLEHLVAVAEEGSLAAAARRVHLSQPALTRSIQALEEEAGAVLLDRGARGVTLTAVGRMVTERARRILFESGCLARDLALVRQHEIGSVQIGFGAFPAAILLPELLCELHRQWPKLRIATEVNHPRALLDALYAEQVDFVVIEHSTVPTVAELEVRRLPAGPGGIFARAGHPLAAGPVDIATLRASALVSVVFPPETHERLRKLLRCKPGEDLPFQVESNDFRALTHLVRNADALLLGPTRAVAEELKAGKLVTLDVPELPEVTMQFSVVWLKQRTLSPAAGRAVGVIEGVAGG